MIRSLSCCVLFLALAQSAWAVDYSRDVRPILSNNCFKCHGPDEANREAGLRLDEFEAATADRDGSRAVAPGDPDSSLLIERITAEDPSERMPPPESGLTLSEKDLDVLRAWIAEGASYEPHWAFRPIERPELPKLENTRWVKNPIDLFILARLRESSIEPSPEADRATLIRRLYLDLLGLPPTPEELTAFLQDERPDAYEQLVERILANPHYGERWGRHWLDQARYADTHGYTVDGERSMWPYRDWVLRALNADMPFDQFTREQLAGDLLPNPTRDQLIATGFHRNTLINQEGGTDPEQFRVEAVMDRVATTGAVWLGLTIGCAQCHSHKFDPVSHREYYQLYAFFNSTEDVNSVAPELSLPTSEQESQLAELDSKLQHARAELKAHEQQRQAEAAESADPATAASAEPDEQVEELKRRVKQLEESRKKLAENIPSTMILRERSEPRASHVLLRGDFLRLGEPVEPNVPAVLPPLETDSQRATRLDLARWLVDPRNPLTARVTVNRVWMRYFGRGIVETENDFGMQSSLPTHPQLLDWLASEFIDRGWSLKQLHRLIVTSATYRQSSQARPELMTIDPENKLLARQNRLRVEAEIVRDLALATSGLLTAEIGGPSVHPPQPDGVYDFTQRQATWPTSEGADRYRRGMYTFFMRSAPYPMLTTFDTPRFDTTCTRRNRSNTPLQSLTLANDQTMVEMAQALGRRLASSSQEDRERLELAFTVCLNRPARPAELERLLHYVDEQRAGFRASPEDAQAVAGQPITGDNDAAELAVWVCVARVLMNLDEFITRE